MKHAHQFNKMWAFLHGKEYILDGVHGHFRHEICWNRYGDRPKEQLLHDPSPQGQQSEKYQELRSVLGDDYSTDLSDSIVCYCEIALLLGYIADETSVAIVR